MELGIRNVELGIKNLVGYARTLRNYLRTPKARHDFKDYVRAVLMILATTLIIFLAVKELSP